MLQDQAEAMSQQLDRINQRIAELEQHQQED
jgi:prefoldin subunit 5